MRERRERESERERERVREGGREGEHFSPKCFSQLYKQT